LQFETEEDDMSVPDSQHSTRSQPQKGLFRRYQLLWKAAALAIVAVIAKAVVHANGLEILTLNALFSGIVAADVFLMGFLLSGVWTDFKEAEKLPGELAASLHAMADEAVGVGRYGDSFAPDLLPNLFALAAGIQAWFLRRENTPTLMMHLENLNESFAVLHSSRFPINLIVRLKQDQTNVRRLLVRISTIRGTSLVSGGYLIAKVTTALLIVGLILAKLEVFYESIFFVTVITLLVTFMILLIQDLDNPFGYDDPCSTADVPLKPIDDVVDRLRALCDTRTRADVIA